MLYKLYNSVELPKAEKENLARGRILEGGREERIREKEVREKG